MIGENGYPETPDYQPRRTLPNGCTNCGLSQVFCDCNKDTQGRACCLACSHPTKVLVWDGDQA